MSELCEIPTCKRSSFALCNCCQKYICKIHINEHCEHLNVQLSPLGEEINALSDELKSFDIHQANIESREKLEQWRVECHEKIDRIFEKKSKELDHSIVMKVSKQTEEISHIQSLLTKLINDQETTRQHIDFLTSSICRLQKQMKNIKQTYIQIDIHPLVVIDAMFQITDTIRPKIDLLSLSPACKTIHHSSNNSCFILTSNDKLLLIHQAPNLCLINHGMNIVQQIVSPFEKIIDMCWSATLEQYILINDNAFYLVDKDIMLIEKRPTRQNARWSSCTCSDASLFLSTNELSSSIMEFSLLPTIELITHWESPVTCEKNEQIDSITYNNGTLALIIRDVCKKSLRIELRFSTTLDCLWSLMFDINCNKKMPFHCCSLSFDEWLVADYQKCRLLHITKYGQMKAIITYKTSPYRTHLFNQNILVVLTKHGKDFHQLV